MKALICDPCKTLDGKDTVTEKYLKVRNRPDLRLDVCEKHSAEVSKLPMNEYIEYVYKSHGFNLDNVTIRERILN